MIWQSCSNRPGKKCPRVPVWVRGGVQKLFGQCPNAPSMNLSGASLKRGDKMNPTLGQLAQLDCGPFLSGFCSRGQTLVRRLEGLRISQAAQGHAKLLIFCFLWLYNANLFYLGLNSFHIKIASKKCQKIYLWERSKVWCSSAFSFPAPRLSEKHRHIVWHFQFSFKNNTFSLAFNW